MHFAAMLGVLAAQAGPEALDLIDLIDEVDARTREAIEEHVDRGDDLLDLPILIEDRAFAPLTRDGSIALFARFSHWRFEPERVVSAFLIGLRIDLDELIVPPEPYGPPPDEARRLERCFEIQSARPIDRIAVRASLERRAALRCGGAP